jgi:hypothetical protein
VLFLERGVEASLLGNKNDDFPARLDAFVLGYRARLVEALAVTYPVGTNRSRIPWMTTTRSLAYWTMRRPKPGTTSRSC